MSEKRNVAIDIDGYLEEFLKLDADISNLERTKNAYMSYFLSPELFQLYYLAIRSSVHFIGEYSDDVAAEMEKWRQASLGAAGALAKYHRESGKPVEPPWFIEAKERIVEALSRDYSTAGDIRLDASLDPRISARAKSDNSIRISIFAREILKTFNTALYEIIVPEIGALNSNVKTDTESYVEALTSLIDVPTLARCMLPYWIFCNDFVHASNIPLVGVSSLNILQLASVTTRAQMMFILLHEYAHIVLGHCGHTGLSLEARTKFEQEADLFAMTYLDEILRQEGSSETEVWIAVRWLFRYQFLDYRVGQLLRKSTFGSPILEDRRAAIFDRAKENAAFGGFSAERGVAILMQLETKFSKKGYRFIKAVADQLSDSMRNHAEGFVPGKEPNLKNPEWFNPWWEEVE